MKDRRELTGDELIWTLHAENRNRFKLVEAKLRWQDKLLWALIAIAGADLIGFHVFDAISLFGHP
jgi:hypothetical protein